MWKDLWHSLKLRAEELNLQRIWMDVNAPAQHEGYHARWEQNHESASGERPFWHIEIPMTARGASIGRLVVEGKPDDQPIWVKIAVLVQIIEDYSKENAESLQPYGAMPLAAESLNFTPTASGMETAKS
jgi:UDP-GlcNAc:undecaprenyl-phosphate/decaprenyl-phosphate GlcNAc-1-phosphate transferase